MIINQTTHHQHDKQQCSLDHLFWQYISHLNLSIIKIRLYHDVTHLPFNMICSNDFLQFAENTYLCKPNHINTLNKLSVSNRPANK